MKIDIISDDSLIIPEYIIDLKNRSKTNKLIEHYEKLKVQSCKKKNNIVNIRENKKFKKKTYRKKGFIKKLNNYADGEDGLIMVLNTLLCKIVLYQ